MNKKRICFDMDGVLFDIIEKWLSIYNKKYNDNKTKADITQWDFKNCGLKCPIEDMYNLLYEEDFYDLKPLKNAIEITKLLVESGKYELFTLSDYTFAGINALTGKYKSLQEHFPHIPKKNWIFGSNKQLFNCDYLVEDYHENLLPKVIGGIEIKPTYIGILINTPYNVKYQVPGGIMRIDDLMEIEKILLPQSRMEKCRCGGVFNMTYSDNNITEKTCNKCQKKEIISKER